jgi:ribosomal protein S18 acetylase RimI-like enzyme
MTTALDAPAASADADGLYGRMAAGLVAASRYFAAGSTGAFVLDEPGVSMDVFPTPPDRDVYNNALFERGLGAAARRAAIDATETAYGRAGIEGYAAWVHESDGPLIEDLLARGYRLSESTRAMAVRLDELPPSRPEVDVVRIGWPEHLRLIDAPEGLLARLDVRPFHLYAARLDGRASASAIAFDHEGDCGIYNVGTLPEARRRGLATALTAHVLHEAKVRGCTTASLQATPMAESVYGAVGFRSLGLVHEYVPSR